MANDKNVLRDNSITQDEIKEVYDALNEENKDGEMLNKAYNETESIEYTNIEEMDNNGINPGIGTPQDINETKYDQLEILKDYNITNEEANNVLTLIEKFKNNTLMNYYNELPQSFKNIADGIVDLSVKSKEPVNRNEAAKMLLNEFIHDAKFNNAMDNFQKELSSTVKDMNAEYNKIFSKAFDKTFAKIDEIEANDPEQAEKIRKVKDAFDNACKFEIQKDFIEKTSCNKLNKFVNRYDSCTFYFNKKVNITNVKIPDIRELVPIINNKLPQYTIDEIKVFIISICKTISTMDFENNIYDLSYIYKMISSIYNYKFIEEDTDESNLLFGNIASVIECIVNKFNE